MRFQNNHRPHSTQLIFIRAALPQRVRRLRSCWIVAMEDRVQITNNIVDGAHMDQEDQDKHTPRHGLTAEPTIRSAGSKLHLVPIAGG